MIVGYTGIPRAGKTTKMVRDLLQTAYDRIENVGYILRKDTFVITNIRGFRLPHLDLDSLMEKSGGVRFFTSEIQKQLMQKYKGRIIYVIDESHIFFPDFFRDTDVIAFFAEHAHYNITVFMATQNKLMICRSIYLLWEIEYAALRQTFQILGTLIYKQKVANEIVGHSKVTFFEVRKLRSFFKSSEVDVHPAHGKSQIYWLLAIAIPLCIYQLVFTLPKMMQSKEDVTLPATEKKKDISEPEKKSQPTAGSPVRNSGFSPSRILTLCIGTVKVGDKIKYVVDPISEKLIDIENLPMLYRTVIAIGNDIYVSDPLYVISEKKLPDIPVTATEYTEQRRAVHDKVQKQHDTDNTDQEQRGKVDL